MHIREASIAEAVTVLSAITEFARPATEAEVIARLRGHRALILVAELSGEAVGVKIGYQLSEDCFYSWLGGVAPTGRRSGVAQALLEAQGVTVGPPDSKSKTGDSKSPRLVTDNEEPVRSEYEPERAFQTEALGDLLHFKSINPIYGTYLLKVLPHAAASERIQALEAVLEFPGSLVRNLRIPRADVMPPGPFTTRYLNPQLLTRGLASPTELGDLPDDWDELPPEERVWPLMFPDKLLRLFQAEFPAVGSFRTMPVWAAGELLTFNGDFNKLVTTRKIARQEGVVFRHVLRFVLLCDEFIQHLPEDSIWRMDLIEIADRLTESCREVDPRTTDMMVESAKEADPLLGA